MKDAALEKAVLALLRPKIERYGEIQRLRIDTRARTLAGELWLLGESEAVEVTRAHYRLETRGEAVELTFHDVTVSRPWLQNLIDDRAPTFTVAVPAYLRALL